MKTTTTPVKFVKHEGEITAVFTRQPYNKNLYGFDMLNCYAHLGQHSGAHKDWVKECEPATKKEYIPLLAELKEIGYTDLKIINKN